MNQYIPLFLIGILLTGFAFFVVFDDTLIPHGDIPATETSDDVDDDTDKTVCIQVITPARNLETGEFREFPTPCDVPSGWEAVSPEALDIDLQVN
jgi:hypothetical protein